MQQHESIDGLVVRVRDMANHDRYLSVLTAERGRITLLSKGSHSLKSSQAAVSQLYTYGNFEFYRRGTFHILKSGSSIHHFYALSMDIDRLNLAAYLCDLTYEMTDEGEDAEDILRLLLNALYAVSKDRYPQEAVKAAFEMRAAVLSGYAPDLSGCAFCGVSDADELYLDVMNGALVCSECLHKRARNTGGGSAYDEIREADILSPLSPASYAALRYVTEAPIERLFSFELKDPEDLRLFSSCAQTYLLSHLGRGFDSLNFYHAMRQDKKD